MLCGQCKEEVRVSRGMLWGQIPGVRVSHMCTAIKEDQGPVTRTCVTSAIHGTEPNRQEESLKQDKRPHIVDTSLNQSGVDVSSPGIRQNL